MTRTRVLVVALLALAVGLAGCGSSPREVTKAEYQKELERVGKAATDAGSELGRSIDIATFNGNLGKFQDVLRDAAGDLDGLKPPPDIQETNELLAGSFRGLADELGRSRRPRRESITKARDALATVGKSQAVKDGRRAIQELKQKGYDTSQLGAL